MSLSWFPLYHGDYLRDTRLLSPAQHGVYLLLLMAFFTEGPLPNDPDTLCRIAAGANPTDVQRILERYWELTEAGWVNRKMEAVRQQQATISDRNRERAIAAANARWKEPEKCLEHSSKQCLEHTAKQCSEVCQPEPEPNTKSKTKKEEGRRFAPPSPQAVDNFAKEHGLQIDSEAFCDFYASKGWKVGNAAMKDWHAAVRNWVRRQVGDAKVGNGTKPRTREQWVAWGQQQQLQAKRGESLDGYVARLQTRFEETHP